MIRCLRYTLGHWFVSDDLSEEVVELAIRKVFISFRESMLNRVTFAIFIVVILVCSAPARASVIFDANGNGVSDIWEARYGLSDCGKTLVAGEFTWRRNAERLHMFLQTRR